MKKLIALFLTVCLTLSVIPNPVYANDFSDDEQCQLLELACATFPEYSDSIMNPVVPNMCSRSTDNPVIVYSEARKASDRVCLIYSRYEDGSVFLTSIEGDDLNVANTQRDWTEDLDKPPVTEITNHGVVTSQSSAQHTLNIKGTHPGVNGYFQITGFTYTIRNSSYDYIDSTGTRSWNGDWTNCVLYPSPRYYETSTAAACATFRATYRFGPGNYYSRQTELFIQIRNNSMTFSHVNFL